MDQTAVSGLKARAIADPSSVNAVADRASAASVAEVVKTFVRSRRAIGRSETLDEFRYDMFRYDIFLFGMVGTSIAQPASVYGVTDHRA